MKTCPAGEFFNGEDWLALAAWQGLTLREMEVAVLLFQGQSQAGVAATLAVTINTVKSYTKNLYQKLGVRNQKELLLKIFAGIRGPEKN